MHTAVSNWQMSNLFQLWRMTILYQNIFELTSLLLQSTELRVQIRPANYAQRFTSRLSLNSIFTISFSFAHFCLAIISKYASLSVFCCLFLWVSWVGPTLFLSYSLNLNAKIKNITSWFSRYCLKLRNKSTLESGKFEVLWTRGFISKYRKFEL